MKELCLEVGTFLLKVRRHANDSPKLPASGMLLEIGGSLLLGKWCFLGTPLVTALPPAGF